MTKIDIISGFLGAGKTTLIKKLIEEGFNGEKLVLIENEFGEIGIDGGFLKDAGVQINEMNSGCICCSLVGDFGKALEQVLHDYNPDRIIIEPSGVGKLSDVMKAVADLHEADIEINSASTVVDAQKCKMYMKNFGEFFNNQVESAGAIILSRSQKLNEDKLNAVVTMLKEHNDKATVITTPWDEINGKQIVAAMEGEKSLVEQLLEEAKVCPSCGHVHEDGEECGHDHHHDHKEHEHHHDHEEHEHHHDHDEHEHHHDHEEHEHHHHDHDCGCHDHHHHHHADDVFTSWGKETPNKYTKTEIEDILKKLADSEESKEYGIILRAKGMVPNSEGGWIYFDLTPEEYEVRDGQPDVTGKLCVIGSELKEDKVAQLFHV